MGTVKVTGRGRGRKPADTVEVWIHLQSKSLAYAELTRKNDEKYGAVCAAVRESGIPVEAIKTASLHVNAEYEYNAERARVFSGYVMTQDLKLRFPFAEKKLTGVLDALSESRADAFLEIRFVCGCPDAHRKELRRAAVEDARLAAETLAEAAGHRLGRLMEIEYLGGRGESFSPTELRPAMLRAAAVDITPEEIEAEEAVQITWEIE